MIFWKVRLPAAETQWLSCNEDPPYRNQFSVEKKCGSSLALSSNPDIYCERLSLPTEEEEEGKVTLQPIMWNTWMCPVHRRNIYYKKKKKKNTFQLLLLTVTKLCCATSNNLNITLCRIQPWMSVILQRDMSQAHSGVLLKWVKVRMEVKNILGTWFWSWKRGVEQMGGKMRRGACWVNPLI